MKDMRRIVIGIGGASGAIYAKQLLDGLLSIQDQWDQVGVVISRNGIVNWNLEIGSFDPSNYPFDFYENDDFNAPFASGSARYDTMIICPCSMGVLGRIAHGISNDLMTRSADVILKERRQLILVPRETPFSLIHIRNMELLTLAGTVICPAIPSFYSQPKSIEEMIDSVISRVLDLAGFDIVRTRWGDQDPSS